MVAAADGTVATAQVVVQVVGHQVVDIVQEVAVAGAQEEVVVGINPMKSKSNLKKTTTKSHSQAFNPNQIV